MAIQVKGHRIDVHGGIRTRSRAKQQAEQWQMVPLPSKLLAMLTDTVAEAQAQKAAGVHSVGKLGKGTLLNFVVGAQEFEVQGQGCMSRRTQSRVHIAVSYRDVGIRG